jgi:Family of unknown function (DUF5995)
VSALAPILPILAGTPVGTIDDVLAVQRAIDAALPPGDGIACFNKLYLAVTTNVRAAEQQGGTFVDVPFLSALDVSFGNLYFAALAALESGASVPRAWAPLFSARARTDVAPLQFALCGMNAHINRDLPVGLVSTFTKLGQMMARPSAQASDFDKVNDVLAATERDTAATYFTPLMKTLDRAFDGVEDVIANWSVREARAAAWVNGTALWRLRGEPGLSSDYLGALDGMVGFAGRGLLVSTAA